MNNRFWRAFFQLSLFPNLKSKACPEQRRRIQNRKRIGILAIAMALLSHWATAYGQEGKTKIRIAIPSASICCLHLFAAQQWKVFEDNGLDVEIIQMRPAGGQRRDGQPEKFIISQASGRIQSLPLCGDYRQGQFGLHRTS